MGSILKKAAPLIGAAAGSFIPGIGTAVGASIGGAVGGLMGGSEGGSGGAAGQATDPRMYPNIKIPGFEYQNGTPTVDMPKYPTMPMLSYNNPVLPEYRLAPATAGEQRMGNALSQSQASILALLNPNNQIFKTLAAEEEQLSNQDFLKGVRELTTANRRSRAQGRGGILGDERGGEQVMRAILENGRDASLQSRIRARGILGDTAGALQQVAQGYGQQANLEQGRRSEFLDQLNKRTGQLREDSATRNSQLRSDTLGAYDDQRSNILNALNLYRNNQATINSAAAKQENYDRQDSAALTQGIKDTFGALKNNGSSSGTWLNPDTGQTVPIGSSNSFLSGLSSFFR